MNRKYVWIGIAVLVSLCLLVSSTTATKTTLKEGYVDLAQSYYVGYDLAESYGNPYVDNYGVYLTIDYEKKGNEYTKYIAYNASVDRVVAYSSIPDVVTQPIYLKAWGGAWVGTGTIKIHKLAEKASYTHVDIVIDLDIDQTWQNSIPSDAAILIHDGAQGLTFSNLAAFYKVSDSWLGPTGPHTLGLGVYIAGGGYPTPTTMCNEVGLTLLGTNQVAFEIIRSADGLHTIGILSDFYNAYEIYVEETYEGEPIKYVDITRNCTECEEKNTRSKVVVLDEDGGVLLDSPYYQDTNTSHPFGSVGITVFLGAANMSEGGTGTEYVLLYSDTEEEPPGICYVKGYTYNAETGASLSGVSVTLNGHSDTSNADGYYFLGPILAGKNYTLAGTKSGYHDRVYGGCGQPPLYLAYGQDYLIDLPMIPEEVTYGPHALLGVVTTLPYNGICENHTVYIENSTWNNSTTTNNIGYYQFNNLNKGIYWINVTKEKYRDNNQTVEITGTGLVSVTIDSCDALTEWDSNNSLTLSTDRKQGANSLQSYGTATLDYNKSFSTAINASEVTKSNGYLAFWYKVDNTTRLNDSITVTIGSNGDNATNKITWSVYKGNFVDGAWKEIAWWLKLSEGTETGTINMSNINWFEFKSLKSDNVTTKIDYIRLHKWLYNIHNVNLDPIFSLGVIAKTYDENIIDTFSATLGDTTKNTTTGQELVFTNLSYGMKELTVTSEGYYPYQSSIYLDSDKNVTAYMQKETEGGAGVYYPPPHLVEFRVQNTWGKPFSNALVTAQGYSTTMGTWDWLKSKFGFDNSTEIVNTTMSDTTDSNGHLSFLMVETVKYQINVSDTESPARFDNRTFWIYPKDERYNLVVSEGWKWQKAGTEEQKEMSINVTTSIINSTAAFLNVSYSDPSNQTTSLHIFINRTVDNNVEEKVFNETWANTSVKDYSVIVSPYKGRAYKIQVVTEHEEWGSRTWTYAKRFEGMLIDLNLPDSAYPMIAVAILLFTGGIWGRSSATQGALIMCFEGWVFYAIGFLSMIPTATILSALALASVVSIIAIMMEKSRKTGVQ